MDHGLIALLMFSSMMLLLLTGKRVFGAIGFVAAAAALLHPLSRDDSIKFKPH